VTAGTEQEFDPAFKAIAQSQPDALVVGVSPFFNSNRDKVVALATELGVPAIYEQREFALAGGLMSYGTSLSDAYRQGGVYAGRILNGEKPADLPVIRSAEFEFVINMKAAETLGIRFPLTLLGQATEIIE
jgi:putative ABC transport system substrate-binding protein